MGCKNGISLGVGYSLKGEEAREQAKTSLRMIWNISYIYTTSFRHVCVIKPKINYAPV